MNCRLILSTVALLMSIPLSGQIDSSLSKLDLEMDYRFRVEHDWSSQKPDGTLRENRSRLRYRLRAGATYTRKRYSVGLRVRTGDPGKQQDPQLTLGKGFEEFGTLPIGFEKAYFQYKLNTIRFWLGKNTYPFKKNNELFWSDNVFTEGIMMEKTISVSSTMLDEIKLTGGHFIIASNNTTFKKDAYFQGIQTAIISKNENIVFFPSVYLFRNIPNIPDGAHSHLLDYTVLHFGARLRPLNRGRLSVDLDYYHNMEDYSENSHVSGELSGQKTGYTFGIQYGSLQSQKDWLLKWTYAYLERYSILDYMAQNDWARWDYSSSNSPDGRLSNLRGIEAVAAYSLTDKVNLVLKYYLVKQLVPYGTQRETGQRIRLDINIKM